MEEGSRSIEYVDWLYEGLLLGVSLAPQARIRGFMHIWNVRHRQYLLMTGLWGGEALVPKFEGGTTWIRES